MTVQAFLREAGRRGHHSALLAGLPADEQPDLGPLEATAHAWVRFGDAPLPFPIPGMSDVMPYPSTRFYDLSEQQLERYQEAFAARIDELRARFRPDVVHSHHLWIMSAVARQVCAALPMVCSCHGSDLRQLRSCDHLRARVLEGCRGVDRVLALTSDQRAEIGARYGVDPDRIDVVGAGYRAELFAPGARPPPPPVELVYAGKLSRAKGVPSLLRALTRVDARLRWRLRLIGSAGGAELEEVMALAGQLGDRVETPGAMTQEALAQELARAHLFILPSFYEGLPLVLLEALASGCRLVATALPGATEALAALGPDHISWIELPPMVAVDQPRADALPAFEQALAATLEQRITALATAPPLEPDAVRGLLERFTWSGVFARVEASYGRARAARASPSGSSGS